MDAKFWIECNLRGMSVMNAVTFVDKVTEPEDAIAVFTTVARLFYFLRIQCVLTLYDSNTHIILSRKEI